MQELEKFETVIRELTKPVNNQYPRPFTCDFKDPLSAKGLLLGYNQARTYDTSMISHQEFLDYHFGRKGTSSQLYRKFNPEPSPSRLNIERMVSDLGLPILESNVYCFSSKNAKELSSDGNTIGIKLSKAVIAALCPKFIIVFGKKAKEAFQKELKKAITSEKSSDIHKELSISKLGLNRQALNENYASNFETTIIYMRSLALPAWNKWMREYPAELNLITNILKEL